MNPSAPSALLPKVLQPLRDPSRRSYLLAACTPGVRDNLRREFPDVDERSLARAKRELTEAGWLQNGRLSYAAAVFVRRTLLELGATTAEATPATSRHLTEDVELLADRTARAALAFLCECSEPQSMTALRQHTLLSPRDLDAVLARLRAAGAVRFVRGLHGRWDYLLGCPFPFLSAFLDRLERL